MTKYGRSVWLDRFPKSRVPSYPRYRGSLQADVVIIGGGLTGCLTGYALAGAGMKVVLLEAGRVGRGNTGFSSGWIADDPGVPFAGLVKSIGLRHARHAWQSWRRAALDFSALLRRLEVRCNLVPQGTITVAVGSEQLARLRRDQQARISAGLDAPFLTPRTIKADAALDAAGGVRGRDGARFDPYRACLGVAAAAAERRLGLFENSPVRRITFTRKHADVITADGSIRAGRVIGATGMPTDTLFRSLARHFWFRSTYLVVTEPIPARVRRQLGRRDSVIRDSAAPPHTVHWIDDDRMLISGADHDTPPPRQRDKVIVQRTGQLMYELSTLYPEISGIQPMYGWMAEYARTGDGLPYIGAHRNFPHHLFVFGDASRSLTGSYLASRILLRQCSGEPDAADAAFGFHR